MILGDLQLAELGACARKTTRHSATAVIMRISLGSRWMVQSRDSLARAASISIKDLAAKVSSARGSPGTYKIAHGVGGRVPEPNRTGSSVQRAVDAGIPTAVVLRD